MTIITLCQGIHKLLSVLLLIFISYSRPNSSYFTSSIAVDWLRIHSVWIIRLIDEIILLSAIFLVRLVSYWGLYRADNRHWHQNDAFLEESHHPSPLFFVNHTTLTLLIPVNNVEISWGLKLSTTRLYISYPFSDKRSSPSLLWVN